MATFKDDSKNSWTAAGTIESINAGSLQRIADATEVMAKNYVQLQNDRDRYEKYYRSESEENRKLYRRIAALQGVITRMKKRK